MNCSVGNDPTNSVGYRLWPATLTNRTLTHEVGHYLGLQHPFDNSVSCTESNCAVDGDEICDTPPTSGPSTCSTPVCAGVILENYMDYTGEACQDMFTAGQSTFMRGVLGGVRNDLVNTTSCSAASVSANFSANITTVTTGGSVTFTDLSTGGTITGWSWNFGGFGTPNASSIQNPTITFNTPGTYTVSLIASNATSNDTETKTSYITVSNYNPLICDTITNELSSDVLTAYGVGSWGAYPGHNSYIMDAYVEPFTVTSATEVQKVIMPIFEADFGSAGSTIDVVVYDDNAGEPGSSLGSQTWLVSDLSAGYYNIVPFSTPVSVNGNFWVGVELNYGTGDTVVLGTATDRGVTGDSTTYLRSGGVWVSTRQAFSNGLNTSLYLDVLTSGSPAVSFSETSLNILLGNTITFDASATVNASTILWDFVNGSPTSSANTTEAVTYNTLGTHDVTLYALGGCRVDSLKKQVVVSNTTSISLNELDASIKVYPNPVKDKLMIQFNEFVNGNVNLDLMDANGRVVYSNFVPNVKNLTHTLDVNKVAKGIYQLRITNQTNTVQKKIIIH